MKDLKNIAHLILIVGAVIALNTFVSISTGTMFIFTMLVIQLLYMRHLRKLKKITGGK